MIRDIIVTDATHATIVRYLKINDGGRSCVVALALRCDFPHVHKANILHTSYRSTEIGVMYWFYVYISFFFLFPDKELEKRGILIRQRLNKKTNSVEL